MFPLVHHYADKIISPLAEDHLMIFGGLFPDLASGGGMERNFAHECGALFYEWCRKNAPEGLLMARSVICHGTEPKGLDYYADEDWNGGPKGWCFHEGKKYMDGVRKATPLGEDYILWKAHNFVEMGLELLVLEKEKTLCEELLAAIDDRSAAAYAADIFYGAFRDNGCVRERLKDVFLRAADIFAIEIVTPTTLAEKQAKSFVKRFGIRDANVPAMAALLEEIREDLRKNDLGMNFLSQALPLVSDMMKNYPV